MTELIVPVKPLGVAKSRLFGAADGGAGNPDAHAELVLAIALDTTLAAAQTPGVHRVLAVSADPLVRATLAANGIAVLDEGHPRGLNGALRQGWRWLAQRHPHAVIGALQADLPALRQVDLAAALAEADGRRAFCADRAGSGTTLLLGAPGEPLNPLFGPNSAAAHTQSGAHPIAAAAPTLRCDVDTEQDLRVATAYTVGRHTAAVFAGARS